MVAAVRLHRFLTQQLFGGGEGVEELVVEVVAVGMTTTVGLLSACTILPV
jgi:hypothetical protein